MSVEDFLALFDRVLLQHAEFEAETSDIAAKKTLLLMELTHLDGIFLKELFEFICWLVSDNEREMYFSKQCGIKFFHSQAKNELLKVSLGAHSRCLIHMMKASEVWKQRLSLSWLKYNLSTNGEGHLVQKSSSLNALSTLALSTRSEALTPKPIRSSKSAAHLPATNVADTSDAQLLKALKTMENQIRSMKVHYGILAPDDSVLEKQLSMSAEEGEMPTTTHDSFISALTDKDCGSELHKSASTDSIKRLDVTFQSEEMPNIAEEEGEEEEGEDNDDGLHGNGGDAAHEMMNTAKLDGDLGRGEGGGDEDSDRVVSVKLALMPKSPEELCELFQVKSPGIFTGEMLQKKFHKELAFKKRFLWLDPSSRTINWAKSLEESQSNEKSTKYIQLTCAAGGGRLKGQCKGIAHEVVFSCSGFKILTESGQYFTVKVPSINHMCWERMLVTLMQ